MGQTPSFSGGFPRAQAQPHATIEGAGHFLQEQVGEALAQIIVRFIADNPTP